MIRNWLIAALSVLFFGAEIYAQSYHISLSGGINYSTLNSLNKDKNAFDLWRAGPTLGLNFEVRYTKYFFLEAGVMYNERGAGQTVGMFNQDPTSTDDRVIMELNHYYLSLPISVGMRTGNRVAPFAQLGTVFSRILKSYNYFPPFQEWDDVGYSINSIDAHSLFDFTMMLRVGVIAQITNRLETFVSTTFEHAIFGLDIARGNQHMGFLGHAGIKYCVGKGLE